MKASEPVSQVLCWHCEEPVHRYATRCPYCQKSLEHAPAAENSSKITSLPSFDIHEEQKIEPQEIAHEQTFGAEVGNVLLSLFTLLSGSFFFFFGLLILLFSKNGTFTLEWKASSWPFFVLSALVLLVTGLWSLSKVDK